MARVGESNHVFGGGIKIRRREERVPADDPHLEVFVGCVDRHAHALVACRVQWIGGKARVLCAGDFRVGTVDAPLDADAQGRPRDGPPLAADGDPIPILFVAVAEVKAIAVIVADRELHAGAENRIPGSVPQVRSNDQARALEAGEIGEVIGADKRGVV